jgi:hypothetical protein
MAAIEDLQPCKYFPLDCEALIAVAWLGRDSEFAKGPVSQDFFEKLGELCREPWQPVASAGFHSCELCQFDPPRFYTNVFVPHQGKIFVAPVAVLHYIAVHWYQPPSVFVSAVLACPAMKSMEYKKAILANGGRNLVKQSA